MTTPHLTRQERRRLEREAAKAQLRQPYIKPVIAAGKAMPAGTVSVVEVRHDDWCPKLSGGICRCEPEIVIRSAA